jgi:hypothetical protein
MTMKTTHKETVAAHPVSTVTIDASLTHRDLSIGQAIERAVADSTKPSPEQSAAATDSHLPKIDIPGLGLEGLRFTDSSPSDSGKGGEHSDPLADLAAAVAGARGRLTAMDPTQHDPTQKGDLHDDWMHQTRPADLLTHNNGSIPSNTSSGSGSNGPGGGSASNGSGGGSGSNGSGGKSEGGTGLDSHHLQRPDGPPPDSSAHNPAESMIAAETGGGGDKKGENIDDGKVHHYKDDKGDDHTVLIQHPKDKDGTQDVYYDKNNATGTEVLVHQYPDGSAEVTRNSEGRFILIDHIDKNGNEHITSGSSGSKGGAGIPDEDHRYTLPPGIGDSLLWDAIKQMQPPSHDGDLVNVAGDDFPGTVSAVGGGATVPTGDRPVDPVNPAGGMGDGGRPTGSPGQVGPGSGNGNIVNTTDWVSQGPGRDERGPPPDIKHDTPGAAATGGQQGNGNDQGAVAVSLVETPAQQAAHALQDALRRNDGGGSNEGPSHVTSQIVPDAGHGAHQDAVSGFADLIRAAQNPTQFGLVTTTQPPGHDAAAMLHLAAQVDIGGHGFGAPGGGHEMTAAAAVVHEDHSPAVIDQHHSVAPVLDHVQVAHH